MRIVRNLKEIDEGRIVAAVLRNRSATNYSRYIHCGRKRAKREAGRLAGYRRDQLRDIIEPLLRSYAELISSIEDGNGGETGRGDAEFQG